MQEAVASQERRYGSCRDVPKLSLPDRSMRQGGKVLARVLRRRDLVTSTAIENDPGIYAVKYIPLLRQNLSDEYGIQDGRELIEPSKGYGGDAAAQIDGASSPFSVVRNDEGRCI